MDENILPDFKAKTLKIHYPDNAFNAWLQTWGFGNQ